MARFPSSSSRLPSVSTSSSRLPPTAPPRLRISPRLLLLRYRHFFRRRPVSIALLSLLSLFIFWFLLSATWNLLVSSHSPGTGRVAKAFLAGGQEEGLLDSRGRQRWKEDGEGEAGTDRYTPSRQGEILGTWQDGFGLEVDAWDPRTHDPRNDPESYGAAVQVKPQDEKYFLSAMIYNRVFKGDRSNITVYELRQWVEYMKYAGVSHIFWYDAAHSNEESQERALSPYVKQGFLTYHRFHELYPGNLDAGYHFEQDQSELHCMNEYGASTRWLAVADVDEYIFFLGDTNPGFMERFLRINEDPYSGVSQILLQTMPFVGDPKLPLPSLLIERYSFRLPSSLGISLFSSSRVKAIVRPAKVERVYRRNPHHFEMREGKTVAVRERVGRINHYQGARGAGGREKSEDFLSSLVEDKSIQPIADELRRILHVKSPRGARVRGGRHYP